tara:strand:+ start:6151 stop:6879 length:729 start_codon:yes stop_codon:yes gene_type:complete
MTKFLKVLFAVIVCTIINSCALQTNVVMSLKDAKKSVLKIETWARLSECSEETMSCGQHEMVSMGTGAIVLYNNSKKVLTAAHVCKQDDFENFIKFNKGHFYLKAIDREGKEYILERVKHNKEQDICLLKSVSGPLGTGQYIKLSIKKPEYGEHVYNIAGPLGMIKGEMVPLMHGQYFGEQGGSAFFSIPVIGGSSGSPVLNSKGELVGMIHSVHYRFHHISLSATHSQLWNFLAYVRNHTL